jgi:heat shock protein HslJ
MRRVQRIGAGQRYRAALLAMLASALTATLCAPAEASYRPPDRIWGRYTAVSVSGAGAARLFDRPKEIGVGLGRDGQGQWIGWKANCNGSGARLRVRHKRMRLGPVASTAIGCPDLSGRQDRWLMNLFTADPRWRLSRRLLVLRAGRQVLRLRAESG